MARQPCVWTGRPICSEVKGKTDYPREGQDSQNQGTL